MTSRLSGDVNTRATRPRCAAGSSVVDSKKPEIARSSANTGASLPVGDSALIRHFHLSHIAERPAGDHGRRWRQFLHREIGFDNALRREVSLPAIDPPGVLDVDTRRGRMSAPITTPTRINAPSVCGLLGLGARTAGAVTSLTSGWRFKRHPVPGHARTGSLRQLATGEVGAVCDISGRNRPV
jgi:hypothetical protein